jgi:hypothetical protein
MVMEAGYIYQDLSKEEKAESTGWKYGNVVVAFPLN